MDSEVAFHHRKRIHDFAFLMHWMSGTLPLHGGQITEWIPIISSALGVHMEMLDHAPTLPHAHQEGHHVPSRTCLVRLCFGITASLPSRTRFASVLSGSRPGEPQRPTCCHAGWLGHGVRREADIGLFGRQKNHHHHHKAQTGWRPFVFTRVAHFSP